MGPNENTSIKREQEIQSRISLNVNWCWLIQDAGLSGTMVPGNTEVSTAWVYLWNKMDIINEVTEDLYHETWKSVLFYKKECKWITHNKLFNFYYMFSLFLCNICPYACIFSNVFIIHCIISLRNFYSEGCLLELYWRIHYSKFVLFIIKIYHLVNFLLLCLMIG